MKAQAEIDFLNDVEARLSRIRAEVKNLHDQLGGRPS